MFSLCLLIYICHQLKGQVLYNGEELSPSTSGYMCAYVSQHDLHHAEMTVRETLNFSGAMLGTNDEFGKTNVLFCTVTSVR